jgi:hypothetical protein
LRVDSYIFIQFLNKSNYLKDATVAYSCILIIFLVLGSFGCHNDKKEETGIIFTPIDVGLNLRIRPPVINPDSLLEMNYEWDIGSNFETPKKKLTVYVHFTDSSGNILFQDDHYPPSSIINWTKNSKINYVRPVYNPPLHYSGGIQVLIGFYDPDACLKRFLLNNKSKDALKENQPENLMLKTSMLPLEKPANEMSFQKIKFKNGWYNPETTKGDSWIWSKDRAIIQLTKFDSDSILFIKGWSDPEFYGKEQWLTLKIGSWSQRTSTDSDGQILEKFIIPQTAFYNDPTCDLEIIIEKPFTPGEQGKSKDFRTLGFMLRQIYYGPVKSALSSN